MGMIDKIKEAQKEKGEGFGFKTVAEYLGGHPACVKKMGGSLITKREGLVFNSMFKDRFTIPFTQITGVDSDTADKLSLGRMLLVGIFAFAWKKKEKFLKVSYKDETGFENSIVFGKLNADEWRGIIVRARQSVLLNNK